MKQSRLIVSLDFELFWGMQDCADRESYGENILGGRRAIPQMLALFEKYGIHATWATVGFLFGSSAEELREYFPKELPAYDDPRLSCYRCFDGLGAEEPGNPLYYGPDLIRQIAAVPGQEIGSHTFSHYYCREPGQTPAQFQADMEAAGAVAAASGYRLQSLVLPRNQTEDVYAALLPELGFTAYRGEEEDWIHRIPFRPLMRLLRLADVYLPLTGKGGYMPEARGGIVNLMGSRMYKPYFGPLAFLEGLKIRRIKGQMRHAAKTGKTFHLWWHPHNVGVRTDLHMRQLEEIFRYYDYLRETYGMCSRNMAEAAEEVLNR